MKTFAKSRLADRLLHDSFILSVMLKAALGVAQILAAIGLAITSQSQLIRFVAQLTASETQQDPTDPLATWLLSAAQSFSIHEQTFYVLYFTGHGLLNLGIAATLVARLRWSYPVSIVVLAAFVIYQIDRFVLTGSWTMIALSLFDVLIIALVWREYRQLDPHGPT